MGDRRFIQKYLAFVGLYQAHYHVERGGFTRAVGSKQSYDLTLFNVDRYMIYYNAVPILLYQVFGMYN